MSCGQISFGVQLGYQLELQRKRICNLFILLYVNFQCLYRICRVFINLYDIMIYFVLIWQFQFVNKNIFWCFFKRLKFRGISKLYLYVVLGLDGKCFSRLYIVLVVWNMLYLLIVKLSRFELCWDIIVVFQVICVYNLVVRF